MGQVRLGQRISVDQYRLGINYYFKGHNANIKVTYENTQPDATGADVISTFTVGLFLTFWYRCFVKQGVLLVT